jgi:hypothetical protein
MYFSSRTDKTKIIQLQNQIESLQATINNKTVSSDTELQKQISKLLEENKSLRDEIALLKSKTESVVISDSEETLTLQDEISEETSSVEESELDNSKKVKTTKKGNIKK